MPTRRDVIAGAAALAAASRRAGAAVPQRSYDVAVIGAGVFGAWTAAHLRRAGAKVALLDALGPANARASSGGESRMTRGTYGRDAVYTRMAHASLPEWKALSERAGLPIFHPTGVLFFGSGPDASAYFDASETVHRQFGLPLQRFTGRELAQRYPAIDFTGVDRGLLECDFGALMARRAVQTLVHGLADSGLAYIDARVIRLAPDGRSAELADGRRLQADRFVFALGPWLPKLFPALLGRRIFVTRQEVAFLAAPPGDTRFQPGRFPGWADWNGGDLHYGFPDLEARGPKFARDTHGPPMDPDGGDRTIRPEALAELRDYIARRFPALAKAPLNETRVCQYENSSNGDFLIDRHPDHDNVVLVGGGSGHGFKHGPEVGRYAARLVMGTLDQPEPRFSLASKAEVQARSVH